MKMKRSMLAVVAAAAVVLTGCGNDSPGNSSSGRSDGLTTIRVAHIPSAIKAPFYLALKKGYFKDEGLDVVPVPVQNGAAVTAALTSGDAQIGGLALVPAVTAASKGVPVKAIAAEEYTTYPSDPTAPYGDVVVLVRPRSGITSAKDLNGKTVAVNGLRNGVDLPLRAAVDRMGGESSSLKLLPIPFPDMVAALDSGQVDAIATLEPFVQSAVAHGDEILFGAYPYDESEGMHYLASVWLTSEEFTKSNPKAVEGFRTALARIDKQVNADPSLARDEVPEFTDISPDVANKIAVPTWDTDVDEKSYQGVVDLMVHYEFIEKPLHYDDFVASNGN